MRYLARRLAHAVAVLLGVSVLSFLLAEASPGSAFDELMLDPQVSPATIDALRDRYGLDRPLVEKYAHWLRSLLRGDLGYSVAHNTPVERAPLAPRPQHVVSHGDRHDPRVVAGDAVGRLGGKSQGRLARSRHRGRYDHAARRPRPAPGTHPAADRRSHRVFPDRWHGLDRLRRSWRVGQGQGRRGPFLSAGHGVGARSTCRCSCGTCARA